MKLTTQGCIKNVVYKNTLGTSLSSPGAEINDFLAVRKHEIVTYEW